MKKQLLFILVGFIVLWLLAYSNYLGLCDEDGARQVALTIVNAGVFLAITQTNWFKKLDG